ncbi:MAG: winged helix-turn-helix transcriptional regulator [Actinobacteria bacterium]|nr:winged helix-turn-helix transcriptional regulator [Actinomycetota bacterium]
MSATEPDPEDPVLHSLSTQSREEDARFVDAARAAVRVARVAANAVGGLGLTLAQYRVLVFVDGVDRTASEVARLLEVSPSTLTSVVDGLCARDFVERRSDPADGRRVVLTITDTGRDRVAAADRAVAGKLSALLGRLGPGPTTAALDGLDLLNDAMDDYVAEHFGLSS